MTVDHSDTSLRFELWWLLFHPHNHVIFLVDWAGNSPSPPSTSLSLSHTHTLSVVTADHTLAGAGLEAGARRVIPLSTLWQRSWRGTSRSTRPVYSPDRRFTFTLEDACHIQQTLASTCSWLQRHWHQHPADYREKRLADTGINTQLTTEIND